MMPGTGGSRVTVLQMMSRAMAALGVVVALCTLAAAAVALNREQVTALPTVPSGNGVTIRLQDHQLDPTANVFFATALEPTAPCTFVISSGGRVSTERFELPDQQVIGGVTYRVQGWTPTVSDGDQVQCPGVEPSALLVGADRTAYSHNLATGMLFASVVMLAAAAFFWFAQRPFARHMDQGLRRRH